MLSHAGVDSTVELRQLLVRQSAGLELLENCIYLELPQYSSAILMINACTFDSLYGNTLNLRYSLEVICIVISIILLYRPCALALNTVYVVSCGVN
jgi:hypothetical protein